MLAVKGMVCVCVAGEHCMHLFWVWIFKELGRLRDISEVLGKA